MREEEGKPINEEKYNQRGEEQEKHWGKLERSKMNQQESTERDKEERRVEEEIE